MALTKATAAVDACQEIAQNTVLEGATTNCAGMYGAMLHIWSALCNTTAHTGTKFTVQISANSSGNEDWTDLLSFVDLIGTGNTEVITNDPLSASGTSITVADTTGYTTNGSWRFLEDVTTFENSEWIFQTAYTTDTSITIMDGVTREHAVNSILNNIAECRVIRIPVEANRVRIVYDNTYDADGATVAVRSRISSITAL